MSRDLSRKHTEQRQIEVRTECLLECTLRYSDTKYESVAGASADSESAWIERYSALHAGETANSCMRWQWHK